MNFKDSSGKQAALAQGFVGKAYGDYLAARTLLRNGLTDIGAGLGATSIGYYLKALIAIHGEKPEGHMSPALIDSAKKHAGQAVDGFRIDFLDFLAKAYDLRHLDTLPVGFNISLAPLKILAELDHVVWQVENGFSFKADGKAAEMRFKTDLKNVNPLLFEDNHILQNVDKATFVARPQRVVDLRVLGENNQLRAEYPSTTVTDARLFTVSAFTPQGNDGKNFKLAYMGPEDDPKA